MSIQNFVSDYWYLLLIAGLVILAIVNRKTIKKIMIGNNLLELKRDDQTPIALNEKFKKHKKSGFRFSDTIRETDVTEE